MQLRVPLPVCCSEEMLALHRLSNADHFAQATTSLHRLRRLLLAQQAAASNGGRTAPGWVLAMAGPDASWRTEEAKLLWAQGQQDTAVALARSLLGARQALAGGQVWRGLAALCNSRSAAAAPGDLTLSAVCPALSQGSAAGRQRRLPQGGRPAARLPAQPDSQVAGPHPLRQPLHRAQPHAGVRGPSSRSRQ